MGTFVVNYGNLYVGNRNPLRAMRILARGKPTALIVVEGRRAVGLAARFLGYRMYVSPYGDKRGRTDVVVFTRKETQHLGMLAVRVQRAMPKIEYAHERYLVAALVRVHGVGKVAFIGYHPTPGPKALVGDGRHPIAQEYQAAMDTLDSMLTYLRTEGFKVVIGGDVQIPRHALPTEWSPYVRLPRAGVRVTIARHVDLLAASSELVPASHGVLSTQDDTGSDHPFLTATYQTA